MGQDTAGNTINTISYQQDGAGCEDTLDYVSGQSTILVPSDSCFSPVGGMEVYSPFAFSDSSGVIVSPRQDPPTGEAFTKLDDQVVFHFGKPQATEKPTPVETLDTLVPPVGTLDTLATPEETLAPLVPPTTA